jgi:RimJ/RimL family protein N-acetyltransferase
MAWWRCARRARRTRVKAAWGRDVVVVRWTRAPVNYTEEAALPWAPRAEEAREAGHSITLAIADARSGAVLGPCDIRRPESEDAALGEVGYLLAEEARDRGVATRATWLLVDWRFRALGMERVQALAHPDNPRSAGVLERLGFRREGRLRRYRPGAAGREDRVLYSVVPGELTSPAAAAEP